MRDELREWLRGELGHGADVVVKDPRTVWFLPLWTEVAAELGAGTATITMLRHPAEVIASAKKSYGDWQSDASRASAWINVILETERVTRDGDPRVRRLRGRCSRTGRARCAASAR